MGGETDLGKLLANMAPELSPGEFVFCTFPKKPPHSLVDQALGTFREAEGITLILPREVAERAGIGDLTTWKMITLTVHSSLEAVGFLASVTRELAAAGLSANTVSAFYHDHLFVPPAKAEQAMGVLQALARRHQVRNAM